MAIFTAGYKIMKSHMNVRDILYYFNVSVGDDYSQNYISDSISGHPWAVYRSWKIIGPLYLVLGIRKRWLKD